jgi:hypothetical protein
MGGWKTPESAAPAQSQAPQIRDKGAMIAQAKV